MAIAAIGFLFLLAGGLSIWFLQRPDKPRSAANSDLISEETVDSNNLSLKPEKEPFEVEAAAVADPLKQAEVWKREAVEAAREVVETFPENAISHALLGSAYFNIGQSEEAVESLRRCVQMDPNQPEAYEILARIAYDKGELEEAVRLCEQGLKHGGEKNPALVNRLGRSLLDLGKAKEAIRVLEPAQASNRSSEGSYLLGQAHLQNGDPGRAKESFLHAVESAPDHTQAYFGLFTACMRLNQAGDAARYRERFLNLEAADRQALTDRSAQEDTLTGLPLLRQTVARTFFGAGQVYRLHRRIEKAEAHFFKAAAIDPDHAMSRAALESLLLERNAGAEAVDLFEKLASAQPDVSLNHLFLGRLHERRQDFEATERAYRKVVELAPDRPDGYRGLIELYLKTERRLVEVRGLVDRLLELEPNSGPNYYLLAFACLKNNDRQGAVEAMEKAVVLSPGNGRFEEFLRQLKEAP